MRPRTSVGLVALVVGTAFFIVFGGWAFVSPRSFFENVAAWDPFNAHFLRDSGAFSVGVGTALAFSLKRAGGTTVALAGGASAAVLHAISHIIDAGSGGRASDPYTLSALAVLLVVGLVIEWRKA